MRAIKEVVTEKQFNNRIVEAIRNKNNYFLNIAYAYYCTWNDFFTKRTVADIVDADFLRGFNKIYSTRVSSEDLKKIEVRLREMRIGKIESTDSYKEILKCFVRENENHSLDLNKNALSLGTKFLHHLDPEKNPIVDSVIAQRLGIGSLSVNKCLEVRQKYNQYIKKEEALFAQIRKKPKVLSACYERGIEISKISNMKLLDIALY